ncbi:hypothetical protein EC968_006551 [Mortierella alpina]|nr:hypothetical protein EC968_006551 [Mortierella alpina]
MFTVDLYEPALLDWGRRRRRLILEIMDELDYYGYFGAAMIQLGYASVFRKRYHGHGHGFEIFYKEKR